jgi:tetratricopeptide (TPR) repeat protein
MIDIQSIPLNKPLDLAVWSVMKRGLYCKIVPTQTPVTFRQVGPEVEGEIITLMPAKIWQMHHSIHLTGTILNRRLDVPSLHLAPLQLRYRGPANLREIKSFATKGNPFQKYYQPILDLGARHEFEMEQVIPFEDPEAWDMDPITEAAAAYEDGDHQDALKIIKKLLHEDLRCIDAHAHLGNWEFSTYDTPHPRSEDMARRHYEAGVAIAESSFPQPFKDLLPYYNIDNRPYLRCLHGYGLCLWRAGKVIEAQAVFKKLLQLNPYDQQGARFLLASIDAGETWYEQI